jgi:uncharacterized protein (TIGR02300 family)
LTACLRYGKAPAEWLHAAWRDSKSQNDLTGVFTMVKAEWGSKRTCPKCATRFYDLGKEDPVTCIDCGTEWVPEPVLKSKQPLPFENAETTKEKEKADSDLGAEDLEIDEDEEPSADDEVDLSTGDDDLGVTKSDDDDDNN